MKHSTLRSATLAAIAIPTIFALFAVAGCSTEAACERCGFGPDATPPIDPEPTADAAVELPPEANACEAYNAVICAVDQPERECYHSVLTHQVCTTERGEALSDALGCMRASGNRIEGCATFADAADDQDCIRSALSLYNVDVARPVAEEIAQRCEYFEGDDALYFYPLPLATLTESTVDALTPCIIAATDCDGVDTCFETRFPEIFGCF